VIDGLLNRSTSIIYLGAYIGFTIFEELTLTHHIIFLGFLMVISTLEAE